MNSVVSFTADVDPSLDIPANQSHPILDEYDTLVGAFNIKSEGKVLGFLSLKGYPLYLEISSGWPFHFTPMFGKDGKIEKAVITVQKIGIHSTKITKTEESI